MYFCLLVTVYQYFNFKRTVFLMQSCVQITRSSITWKLQNFFQSRFSYPVHARWNKLYHSYVKKSQIFIFELAQREQHSTSLFSLMFWSWHWPKSTYRPQLTRIQPSNIFIQKTKIMCQIIYKHTEYIENMWFNLCCQLCFSTNSTKPNVWSNTWERANSFETRDPEGCSF